MRYPTNPYLNPDYKPFHYQWEGIKALLNRSSKILGDETGLGKTIQAIYTFTFFLDKYPGHKCLVLCEKSTVYQWKKEFEKFTVGLNIKTITAQEYKSFDKRVEAVSEDDGTNVYIMTYSCLRQIAKSTINPTTGKPVKGAKVLPSANKMIDAIRHRFKDEIFLICDEPNLFKNVSTDMHKIMRYISTYCIKIIGLTAMIFENRLEEAYGMTKVIDSSIFSNKEEFIKTYCKWWSPRLGVKVITGYKNLSHFKKTMEPVLIRRGYDDPGVKQEIPEERETVIEIELTKAHSQLVSDAMDGIINTYEGMKEVESLAALTWQQKLVNSPIASDDKLDPTKLIEIADFVDKQLAHDRVLIFSRFENTISEFERILKNVFNKDRIKLTGRITGKESAKKRDHYQEMFSDAANISAVILATSAAAKGLNLQSGRILLFIDNPWGYGTDHQLLGRLKRTGSVHKNIIVYRFLAKLHKSFESTNTIDHAVLKVLHDKKKLFDAVDNLETDIDTDFTAQVINSMVEAA